MITGHYDDKLLSEGPEAALRLAQQLVVVTPEFHSTSLIQFSGMKREVPEPPLPSNRPYKAVVYILLAGGKWIFTFHRYLCTIECSHLLFSCNTFVRQELTHSML